MTFSLLTLYIADMGTSLHFYRDLMGMRVVRQIDRPGGGIVFLEQGGGVQLELIEDKERAAAGYSGFSVGFDVEDMAASVAALEAAGYQLLRGPIDAGGTTQLAFFAGPNGETVELVRH